MRRFLLSIKATLIFYNDKSLLKISAFTTVEAGL